MLLWLQDVRVVVVVVVVVVAVVAVVAVVVVVAAVFVGFNWQFLGKLASDMLLILVQRTVPRQELWL